MADKILFVAPTTWDKEYTMWFTFSPASGNTTRIPFARKNVLKGWAKGGDYDATNSYDISQLEKTDEFKKARVVKKRNSVVRTIAAPIYENTADKDYPKGRDAHGYPKMGRYDIYGLDLENTIKPKGKMYIVHIQDAKYTHVHFFLTRKEASYWVKSMSESKIKTDNWWKLNDGDLKSIKKSIELKIGKVEVDLNDLGNYEFVGKNHVAFVGEGENEKFRVSLYTMDYEEIFDKEGDNLKKLVDSMLLKSNLKETRQQGHMQERLFLGQFIDEAEAEVFLSEFLEDSPFKCVININAHRMNFMTNKKIVYAEVVIERGIMRVNTEDSIYSMQSRIIESIFVDEYTLKIVCKDLSLEVIKVK
tara:strand:- start:633 stop:1715 length:1083 start_codon:yes stop_codon:yes gene_type:complete